MLEQHLKQTEALPCIARPELVFGKHYDHMQVINMNARLYDPLLGQFISVDPLSDKYPGWGAYVYCANNPLRYIDPTGEWYYDMYGGLREEAYDDECTLGEFYDYQGVEYNPGDLSSLYGSLSCGTIDAGSVLEFLNASQYGGSKHLAEYKEAFNWSNTFFETLNHAIDLNAKGKSYEKGADAANGGGENSYTMSDLLIASMTFAGTTATAKGTYNVINKEFLRQNMLHGDIVPSLKIPKGLKIIGKYGGAPFALWGIYDVENEFRRGEISPTKARIEQVSNGIGGVPLIGTGWSIGWELGRFITNIPGYDEHVRQPVRDFFGIETQW